ncbi:enoyl-CoA hydratase [Hyphomicrobium sp. NDB2Meth4]|uniref:enoyl-CoA hydratase n=1 Tax=Hyphomicrobium sp. NDB2Meth4 TaxID=1892846 RepID=UPI001114DA73|nr:enoyl-CoA hydratase [Hyphomicrobium sp. NDB2Meth4]
MAPADAAPLLVIDRPEQGVARICLNRPDARNALSLAMIEALHAAITELGAEDDVAAIVLTAAGKVFSSGHDLKELTAHRADADKGLAFFTRTMTACADMMQAIVACPKPVIAAVEGTATAAGCQLVATCDLAIAAESAHFCTPGVNIGLFCSTPMVALTRNVARKRAMQMLLTGELIPAAQAADWGLVNKAVAAEDVVPEALALATQIAQKSPLTVTIGKSAFYAQAEMSLKDAYEYAARVMVDNMMARDAEEGIGAFLGKRKPEWKGC